MAALPPELQWIFDSFRYGYRRSRSAQLPLRPRIYRLMVLLFDHGPR